MDQATAFYRKAKFLQSCGALFQGSECWDIYTSRLWSYDLYGNRGSRCRTSSTQGLQAPIHVSPHDTSHSYTDAAKANFLQMLVQFCLGNSAPAIMKTVSEERLDRKCNGTTDIEARVSTYAADLFVSLMPLIRIICNFAVNQSRLILAFWATPCEVWDLHLWRKSRQQDEYGVLSRSRNPVVS